jgi:hypothetical protein
MLNEEVMADPPAWVLDLWLTSASYEMLYVASDFEGSLRTTEGTEMLLEIYNIKTILKKIQF